MFKKMGTGLNFLRTIFLSEYEPRNFNEKEQETKLIKTV